MPLEYIPENNSITNNSLTQIAPSFVNGTNTGGAVSSWAINNTNLPTGLSFSTTNGTIYGTPTQLWTRTAYKVWANNSGGSSVSYLNITVVDQVPTGISYSPENVTLTNNTASSDLPLEPNITGSGSITSWELNNTSLPTGISFGSTNGTLYGTATQLWTRTSYKVWANNSGGSVVAYFNLTVNDQVPTLSYSPENLTLTINNQSSDLPLNATLTGQVQSLRGRSAQHCRVACHSVQATEQFGERQRPCAHSELTPFGLTTLVAQLQQQSTSPSMMNCRIFPIPQTGLF